MPWPETRTRSAKLLPHSAPTINLLSSFARKVFWFSVRYQWRFYRTTWFWHFGKLFIPIDWQTQAQIPSAIKRQRWTERKPRMSCSCALNNNDACDTINVNGKWVELTHGSSKDNFWVIKMLPVKDTHSKSPWDWWQDPESKVRVWLKTHTFIVFSTKNGLENVAECSRIPTEWFPMMKVYLYMRNHQVNHWISCQKPVFYSIFKAIFRNFSEYYR